VRDNHIITAVSGVSDVDFMKNLDFDIEMLFTEMNEDVDQYPEIIQTHETLSATSELPVTL
jgi:hypothetical protein